MKDATMINGIIISIMLILGCGIFWVISGYADCSTAAKTKQELCKQVSNIGDLMPIGIFGGFLILIYIIVISHIENKEDNKKGKTTV